MRSINFENLLRKHFGLVNREGLGFLESNIKAAAEELNQLTVGYEKVVTLTDEDLKSDVTVVEVAFEPGEVSYKQLETGHFNITRKQIYDASIVVYRGKFGKRVFKYSPKNIALKPILKRLG